MRVAWLWLLVPFAGIVELGAELWAEHRAPRLADWTSLREPVSRLRRDGEAVVIAPRWAEPLARQALGDELMPLRDVARPDESGYRRVIEISILGERTSELASWHPVSEERAGKFKLRILENPKPDRVLFDFVDHVAPPNLEVFELVGGAEKPCAWKTNAVVSNGSLGGNPTFPAQRFQCASGEWFFAGVTVIDDNHEYRPRRCIWSHPPSGGPMRLRFKNVWLVFRDGVGPPIELEVRVAGASLGTYVHRDLDGWAPFSFPTGRAGETADVEIEVRASNNHDRHFCFYADTR